MAAAATAADEPAAKMVKQEKKDYTQTHRSQFNDFTHHLFNNRVLFFPRTVIDGLEVYPKIYQHNEDYVCVELQADIDCANGLMYRNDRCSYNAYQFFYHEFDVVDERRRFDYILAFNTVMNFVEITMPKMKIYDNHLVFESEFKEKTARELLPILPRHMLRKCVGCGQLRGGMNPLSFQEYQLLWFNHPHLNTGCLKCYVQLGTAFDPDKEDDHEHLDIRQPFQFDRLGSRKIDGRDETGLILPEILHYQNESDEEDDEDDDESDDEDNQEEEYDIDVGISVEELDQHHPVFMYQNQEEAASCSVCMEVFKKDDACRVMTCAHTFHKQCIDTWLENHAKCPLCRAVCGTGAAA